MGNLGLYQLMTTMAKRVGGPAVLGGLVLGAGALLAEGRHVITDKVSAAIAKKNQSRDAAVVHVVEKEGTSNEGLVFKVGEAFKVLEIDGDAALVEKLGDANNPYFVSARFLRTISDY